MISGSCLVEEGMNSHLEKLKVSMEWTEKEMMQPTAFE